jgi:hypothetical protein
MAVAPAAVPPIALAPPPAYAPNNGVVPTVAEATAIEQAIRAGGYAVPAARAAAAAHAPATAAQVLPTIPQAVRTRATDNRMSMIGVTLTDVFYRAYTMLVVCAERNNYVALLQDMIIACNMAPGIARSRVNEYAQLAPHSMFRSFEIQGRVADLTTLEGRHGDWIAGSPMHAGAIRLMGLVILANATPGSFLAVVAGRMGTLTAPPARPVAAVVQPGAPVAVRDANERARLLWEAIDEMSPAERQLVQGFRLRWARLIELVEAIYGDAGGDVNRAVAAAALYAGYELVV